MEYKLCNKCKYWERSKWFSYLGICWHNHSKNHLRIIHELQECDRFIRKLNWWEKLIGKEEDESI